MDDCTTYRHKSTIEKCPVGKAIKAKGIWQRVGMELIDMTSKADGKFKWIFHVKCHVSKFSYAALLERKTATLVVSDKASTEATPALARGRSCRQCHR